MAQLDLFPSELSEAPTALALEARLSLRRGKTSDEELRKAAELLVRRLPEWNEDKGSIDFYYWTYGTQALSRFGGAGWTLWCEKLQEALVGHQVPTLEGGYWPAADAWGDEGDVVYSTAFSLLSLQASLRKSIVRR